MAKSKSSNDWLREHFDDPYVKKAQKAGYRSRATFKLEEIDKKDKLIKKVSTTTSIMKDIFKTDRLISKNAVPLSLSGFKSALHRFV